MLTISPEQMQSLSTPMARSFRQRAVQHLRSVHAQQCAGKGDAELGQFVDSLVAFARSHDIRQQQNILRLLDLQFTHRFASALTGYLKYRLTQPGLDESTRVHNFAWALASARNPILVSLASDLQSPEEGRA